MTFNIEYFGVVSREIIIISFEFILDFIELGLKR